MRTKTVKLTIEDRQLIELMVEFIIVYNLDGFVNSISGGAISEGYLSDEQEEEILGNIAKILNSLANKTKFKSKVKPGLMII